MIVVGCSSGSSGGGDAAPATGPSSSVAPAEVQGPAPDGFRAVTVTIRTADGRTVTRCLLVADSEALREQGLMGVTDEHLSGYDGMLFVFDADSTGGFWMKDTLIPLSIAFVDQQGAVVGVADMVPCPSGTKNCPVTKPDAAYRYAVEVRSGALDEVGLTEGSSLDPTLGPACTPTTA
ncbi:MAG: DUF192 domain-containing protein [Acidimicrobiales bacterium]